MHLLSLTGRRGAATLALVASVLLASFVAPSGPGVLATAGASPSRSTAPRQESSAGDGDDSLKSQYDEVLGREAEVLRRLTEATAARTEATSKLTALALQTTSKQIELVRAQQELSASEERAVKRVAARIKAQRRVAAAVERLRRQAVASFVRGGQQEGVADSILKARNGEQAGQILAYGKAALGDTDRLVKELRKARAAQQRAEQEAKAARKAASDTRDQIDAASQFLATARDRQQTLVDAVSAAERSEKTALDAVEGRKALIIGRINSISTSSDGIAMFLANLQRNQPPWVPGSVVTSNPMPDFKVGSRFGMRFHPILHIARLHAGDDIAAPSGTPIRSAADGIVVLAGERGGYGNNTVIDHGNSLATSYNHQSKILVKPGDYVKRGDIIGLVGTTGLSTGPHLHFETRLKGQPIDPMTVVDYNAPVILDVNPFATTTR